MAGHGKENIVAGHFNAVAGQFQAGHFQAGHFQAGHFQAGHFQAGHFQAGHFQAIAGQFQAIPRQFQAIAKSFSASHSASHSCSMAYVVQRPFLYFNPKWPRLTSGPMRMPTVHLPQGRSHAREIKLFPSLAV